MGITALATREVRLTTGSVVGGGEQLFAAWRFWPRRPSLAGGISAPAPWGGVWNVMAYTGRQGSNLPNLLLLLLQVVPVGVQPPQLHTLFLLKEQKHCMHGLKTLLEMFQQVKAPRL
jgi:hypothetical protein